ncbi:hypothetical protein [Acinetobacter pittii]|uniref:hypothetical protein n=1 Tax=Acinetobacter pittii TaxID=48296 RepID=UPI000D0B986D|nr:hypothetical protein [Acinetobacter pittii]MBJ9449523.1 hypothetical protein [Acinetobacter pittii]PSD73922.1 hypothetical protein C7G49_13730 [Acinetobacter pittii]
MAFDIVEKNKDITFPFEWVDFPSGGKFKVNGIMQPEFQRALEIFNQETAEEAADLNLISNDRIQNRNDKFAYAVGVFLVNDWKGIELSDGSVLEYTRENVEKIFCKSAQKTQLIDFVIQEATRIQTESLKAANALLGKSQPSTTTPTSSRASRTTKKSKEKRLA